MMTGRLKLAVSIAVALIPCAQGAVATSPAKLSGSIAGIVRDGAQVPQMGATVLLFNRYERLVERTLTNEHGLFGFAGLSPDLYSVRVTLASFVPAVKQKIAVQPGVQSLLYVDLASLISSIELVYASPSQGALMSDDWKWTLKASTSTRPILHVLPEISVSDPTKRDKPAGANIFSDTTGILKVSAGDPGSLGGTTSQADLGTAFALATSLFGRNQLQVSGNVGYSARAGLPAAGFHTSFSRDGFGPEVAVTVQQVYLPARGDAASFSAQNPGTPALRTVSTAVHDTIALSDNIRVDYGASMDSISFIDHLNYISKFARLTYTMGMLGAVQVAYNSGAPPVQFLTNDGRGRNSETSGSDAALAADLVALSVLPRLSMLDGNAAVQRSQDFEIGYEKQFGQTTIDVTGFRDSVTNLAMTISAPDDLFAPGELLPDISSKSSVLNGGSFQRFGYAASVSQRLGDKISFGASAGRAGALTVASQDLNAPTAEAVRGDLRQTQRFWASARASAILPITGTEVTGSYQWTDYRAMMPAYFYMTQRTYPEAGLNIRVRQPIPSFPGIPGRLEATAELRNLLAQGYLRVNEGSQSALLIQNPRAVRGGLSFIF